MRLWYLSHRRPAKIQASLHIGAVSPELSLFTHMKYGSRWRVWLKIRYLALLDGCAGAFEDEDEKCYNLMSWLSCNYMSKQCSVDPDQTLLQYHSDLGLNSLLRPFCPKTSAHNGIEKLSSETHIIWAASSEFGTYWLCEQRRFRRACASEWLGMRN